MARARQKLLKFTFQDFGIDGLMKSRLRWLVGFFRMDGKTIEHISLLGHSSGGCGGVGHFVVTFLEVGLLKRLFKIDILTRKSRVEIISLQWLQQKMVHELISIYVISFPP